MLTVSASRVTWRAGAAEGAAGVETAVAGGLGLGDVLEVDP
jgi:hypothetical protein